MAWVFRAGVVARALETDRLVLVLVGLECFACLVRLPPGFDTFVEGRRRAPLDFGALVFRVGFGLLDDALADRWALLLERRAFTPPP